MAESSTNTQQTKFIRFRNNSNKANLLYASPKLNFKLTKLSSFNNYNSKTKGISAISDLLVAFPQVHQT